MVRGVFVHEKRLTDPAEYRLEIGAHCENILFETEEKRMDGEG